MQYHVEVRRSNRYDYERIGAATSEKLATDIVKDEFMDGDTTEEARIVNRHGDVTKHFQNLRLVLC